MFTERSDLQIKKHFSILYITLVRPILEYAAPVWCPYPVKDALAALKRSREGHLALRLDREKRGGNGVRGIIKILDWPTLEKQTLDFT